MRKKWLSLLLCLAVILSVGTPGISAGKSYTVAEVERFCDGIVGYKDGSSAQHFIDHGLCENAGISAEFYIIALSQQGSYRFSAYETALTNYLNTHEIRSATSREKYALALIAAGSHNAYISKTANEAIGGLGLMSLVFGLHLLNNGCSSKLYTAQSLVNTILSYQLSDGGWAVIGTKGDVDVTAMTLQSLAPYYRSDSKVKTAINRALTLLSERQQPDGGFYGMGVENCESAAQVLTALSDLGIEQASDSRFIKNGSTVLDAILRFRNTDGSFCHVAGGSANETATMEAFYALTAYLRHCRGKGPLYMLDNRYSPTADKTEAPTEKATNRSGNQHQTQTENRSATTSRNNSPNNHDNQSSGNDPSEQEEPADNDSGSTDTVSQPQQNDFYSIDNQPQNKATESPSKKATGSTSKALAATAATQTLTESPTVRDAGKGAGIFQPTGEATAPTEVQADPPAEKGGYKPYAIGGIIAAALIAALALYCLKKRNKKHYIAVGIIAAAGILLILLTDFESPESYHTVAEKTDTTGTVTISVRCDALKDDVLPDHIPDDCIILGETTFTVAEGDTVYDILIEASKRCHFQIDNRGAAGNAYIAGIEYLYEYDYGDLSGWMYKVDGEFPDVGCQQYVLHGGETIEWLYTKNIGKDL